ncbi:D-2-hydroxyacid dehydrogenase [Bacteroides gallinaceum]|uniref:D-2-hydroxyacid dehydrogenase n=2 Tax=Bacteroidaceae TaxID=815 RepID=A0ABT7X788_9BACE|nr:MULTISPECIES: D-2-hydroxyacid dehydrogenase [Bacteroidaceae]CCZ69598.1 phosphoglycerate dehydrogenase [Bacteroides sp. CAG:702]MBD8041449.1 D-2-hydroxyacid dehydrogenase [Phocaeicola intestinalis]MBM6658527.1 D-2-hydroxyacid dehydrogenase [Bacteroides gallinaceum]MBM6719967.1 D-2-hydroxyacid dehydrogenase [Bacteroides gallinaceum]MDN0049937.1 D-2-hydroxyacid dehydrogenase [Bacteroides gallinaceum]
MKIVVLDGYTLNPGEREWEELKELGELTVHDRTSQEDVIRRAEGADVVLTNKVVLDRYTLEHLPDLKYIGVLATGYNIIDLEVARKQGIVVTNIPAYSTDSVVQMAFAHILNITLRVGHYANEVHNGVWSAQNDFSYRDTPLVELAGKRIGLVGFGHIGQAMAKVASAFGMKVVVCPHNMDMKLPKEYEKAKLNDVFSTCDIVSLHCPLTSETKEMVNSFRLSLMKKGSILINTGRGGLIDEKALERALLSGKLLGAGLDVLSSEPPSPGNPLLKLKNCFITPHIAWATQEARERLMKQVVDNLQAWIGGKPINNVLEN